jgi:predicted DNA-binding transcriptional regulator AlpA
MKTDGDPIAEEVSSNIVSRINGLTESARLLRFPTRHSLESVAKQWIGRQTQDPAPQKIIVSDSRPTPIRGLDRDQAATYIGVSASKFDELIKDGRMPPPKRIDGRVVWDIRQIDKYFDRLPGGDRNDRNPWDTLP